MTFKVAVISAQGDVDEHVEITKLAMEKTGIEGEVFPTMDKRKISESDAIILPGGESTAISKFIHKTSVGDEIKKAVKEGKPVMGTCAGSILLAKYGDEQIGRTSTKLLGLMEIWVKRNAYGRQRESFQTKIYISEIGEFEAVFIRAPAILKVGKGVRIMAKLNDYIVAARQDNMLALTFHPELTHDTRLHEYFIKM